MFACSRYVIGQLPGPSAGKQDQAGLQGGEAAGVAVDPAAEWGQGNGGVGSELCIQCGSNDLQGR